MKNVKNSIVLLAAASLMSTLSACNLPPSPDFVETPAGTDTPEMMQKFEVSLEAPTTAAGPLSPGVYIVHASGTPLFTAGAKDMGLGLERIAEDGNPAMAGTDIAGAVVFNTPAGDDMPGPASPGKKFSFTIMAKPGDHLSFATMHVQSNDGFYAPADTGIALFNGNQPISGDMTAQAMLWDAGTEINQEPGMGADQAPRQSAPNTGASESEPIQLMSARDNFTYTPNLKLTITPIQ
jgi:hypothetical protein